MQNVKVVWRAFERNAVILVPVLVDLMHGAQLSIILPFVYAQKDILVIHLLVVNLPHPVRL